MHRKPKLHRAAWKLTGWGGTSYGEKFYVILRCTYPGCHKVIRKKK